jgi:hypothetical protein
MYVYIQTQIFYDAGVRQQPLNGQLLLNDYSVNSGHC